jgi:hypothetical protein
LLTKQICFVLGAGASAPYGFPPGSQLMESICGSQPDDWWPLAQAIADFDRSKHDEFVLRLRQSGVTSIDQYAGGNPASQRYAKALIARYIGQAEASNPTVHAVGGQADWMSYLKQHFSNPAQRFSDLPSKPPHVITFNYDRSFEEGMLVRLVASFEDATRALVADVLRNWKIVHVHGFLDGHPDLTDDGHGRPYGSSPFDLAMLESAVKNIKLVREARDDSPEFTLAKELIGGSELVIFLGFAFDPLNLSRLFPVGSVDPIPSLIGTVRPDVTSAIRKASVRRIVLNGPSPGNCRELLDEHAHTYSD